MTVTYSHLLDASRTRPGNDEWLPVCAGRLVPAGGGVAARVRGHQVAIFRTDDRLYALDNRDPFTGANVLSRGIVGSHGGVPTVASPLRKQRFDLRSGACLDVEGVAVAVHEVQEVHDTVEVRLRHAEVPA